MSRLEWVGSHCGVVTDVETDDYVEGDWEPCTECDDTECIAVVQDTETDA